MDGGNQRLRPARVRLDQTVNLLQAAVAEQENALLEARAAVDAKAASGSPKPSGKLAHIQQLRVLKSAFASLTETEPYLPPSDSPLPALLAVRNTHVTSEETKRSLAAAQTELEVAEGRLDSERIYVNDARLLATALDERISALREEVQHQSQRPASQIGRDILRDLRRKMLHYEEEATRLDGELDSFVDKHLAPMLAAEELGGPVVGGLVHVDDSALERGDVAPGKASHSTDTASSGKRQQRIDEFWEDKTSKGSRRQPRPTASAAAGAEMRELVKELINRVIENGSDGSAVYVDLPRDSAAARFLVRSMVAQLHPRDANRIRLIDFGRDLDE